MDLPIVISKDLLVPLHRQLTDAVRDAITSGRLAAKQALPSTRELAESLSISRRTVVRSYNDLTSQGYLETTFGGGTFVSRNPPIDCAPEAFQPAPTPIDNRCLSDFTKHILRSNNEMVDFGNFEPLNFCAGPADLLPIKQWRQVLSKYLAGGDVGQLDYVVDIAGFRELREQLCQYLRRSKALRCDTEQILAFADTFSCLDLTATTLINPGDSVVVENPGYIYARQLFEAHGAKVHALPVDEDGLIVEQLYNIREHCKLMLVTPSHHDPTGAVMSLPRRHSLLNWANDNCDFIVEDGFDSDYFYSSAPLPSLHGLDQSGKVIYIHNFWKLLYPLTAMGYLVIPHNFVDAFVQTKQHVNRFFSAAEQRVLADFIREGHLERHWHKTRAIYKRRRQAVMFALRQAFRNKVDFFGEGAGLHITVRFDLPLSMEQLSASADAASFPMVSTMDYYARDPVECEFLVPFCVIPEERAAELVALFAEHLNAKVALPVGV